MNDDEISPGLAERRRASRSNGPGARLRSPRPLSGRLRRSEDLSDRRTRSNFSTRLRDTTSAWPRVEKRTNPSRKTSYRGKQLGHRKPTTTLQFYAHWLPQDDTPYLDRLTAARQAAGDLSGDFVRTKRKG
jgi:hypothetical protein